MIDQPRHEMELMATHASGAEEWYCPTCGRRFLMQWPPAYKKIVLEPGDELALHSGGKGGLRLGAVDVDGPPEPTPPDGGRYPTETALSDEMRDWLREAGFESWWGEAA